MNKVMAKVSMETPSARKSCEQCSRKFGLLPQEEIEEGGILREKGFVWLKQNKKKTQKFKKINKLVLHETEVARNVEANRIEKLTGIKAKELHIWITLTKSYMDNPPIKKITVKTPAGLPRCYPVHAFIRLKEPIVKDKNEDVVKDKKEDSVKDKKEDVVTIHFFKTLKSVFYMCANIS